MERELTVLTRRVQKVHLETRTGPRPLERALYSILRHLHEHGPLRSGALAAELHVDPSTVSRHVAALIEAGMVVREADAEDGRAALLRLTPAGHEALTATRSARQRLLRDVLASWSPEECAAFAELLEAFNAGLEQRMVPPSAALAGARSSLGPVTRSMPAPRTEESAPRS